MPLDTSVRCWLLKIKWWLIAIYLVINVASLIGSPLIPAYSMSVSVGMIVFVLTSMQQLSAASWLKVMC